MTPTVFLDLETCGLALDDDIWEFAAIRREEDGTETRTHLFVQHDPTKCARLPEAFLADHQARFPISHGTAWHPDTVSQEQAALAIAQVLDRLPSGPPRIVGAVPHFDTERLARLLRAHDYEPRWHHRLRCVETLTAGHLRRDIGGLGDCADALGIQHDPALAHTAMGDTELAMRIWDKVMTP